MKTKGSRKYLSINILFYIALLLSLANSSCTQEESNTPILVLATHSNFGTYTSEILKAEGFNEFLLDSLSSTNIKAGYLDKFDIVILAEGKIDPLSKILLESYVNQGGNLIAFRPDPVLSKILGINPPIGKIAEGYIQIEPANNHSKGLTNEEMQYHGIADSCTIAEGQVLATIFSNKNVSERAPGVVSNAYGNGHAIAFLYNLPKSIVYTRQGNPLSAGLEKDGIPGLRGMDLFTDGWIDTATNTLNQADQQMALLSNCIQELSKNTKPLPRLWYFPDSLKCLAVLDNDGEDNNEADFEPQFRDVDSMGAKMTIYIKDVDKVSKAWVDKWTAKGFEISGHPDDTHEAGNPRWASMDSAVRSKNKEITEKFGSPMRTNVNHWFVWCGTDEDGKQDFGAQARIEEKNGIEMDANYALYDINSNQVKNYLGTPGYSQGNYTGSGLVMKYADVHGKTVNVYQRYNAVYDQQYNEGSTGEEFFNCFKGLVDRSINYDIFSIVSIKAHNNEYYFSKEPLMKMLDYANENNVPVWTALELLNFLKMKDEASFSNIKWDDQQLTFNLISNLSNPHGLSFLLPAAFNNKNITNISINGAQETHSTMFIKGAKYAMVTVNPGTTHKIKVFYE